MAWPFLSSARSVLSRSVSASRSSNRAAFDQQFLYDQAGMGQGDDGVAVHMAHRQWRPVPVRAQEGVAVAPPVLPALSGFLAQYPHVGGQADPALDGVMGTCPADLAQVELATDATPCTSANSKIMTIRNLTSSGRSILERVA